MNTVRGGLRARARGMNTVRGGLALALAAGVAGGAIAPAPAGAEAVFAIPARLAGTFQMNGRVTVAKRIRGEHRGDLVQRVWSFTPLCPTGPCQIVRLTRQRAGGSDTLRLHQVSPGSYVGHGRFYAGLRCGRHLWRRGERVPFTIRLQITASAMIGDVPVASGVHASYVNRRRINRTRCVAVPGHDAAVYDGQPV